MITTKAWAIISYARNCEGECLTKTVGPTPRSAKVNWLFTFGRIHIHNAMPDAEIEALWERHHGLNDCEAITITHGK